MSNKGAKLLAKITARKAPPEPETLIDMISEGHSARHRLLDVLKAKAPATWLKDLLGHPALREPEPTREPVKVKADEPNSAAGAREQLLAEMKRHAATQKEPPPPAPFVEPPPTKAPVPEPEPPRSCCTWDGDAALERQSCCGGGLASRRGGS